MLLLGHHKLLLLRLLLLLKASLGQWGLLPTAQGASTPHAPTGIIARVLASARGRTTNNGTLLLVPSLLVGQPVDDGAPGAGNVLLLLGTDCAGQWGLLLLLLCNTGGGTHVENAGIATDFMLSA